MSDVAPDSLSPSQVVYPLSHVDLSKPRYDQSTYVGRAKHFFETASPLTIFASKRQLAEAAQLVKAHQRCEAPPGTTENNLWEAKKLYDSAYHPDTGEKMFILGRMSFQVPGNMTIVGLMMTYYKTNGAVLFWQFANQTFNAIVNYTNRSGNEIVTTRQIMVPYIAATTAATATAFTLNMATKRMPPLIGRLVPFIAVASANSLNIPLMRQREIEYGVPIYDEDGNNLGMSTNAAKKGIGQVVLSRVVMASPGMALTPFIMNALEKRGVFKRMPKLNAPLQIALVGLCLAFATPLGCALFPQQRSVHTHTHTQSSSMLVSGLELELREKLQSTSPHVNRVYFNKGL